MDVTNLLEFEYKDMDVNMSVRVTKYVGTKTTFRVSSLNSLDPVTPGLMTEALSDEGEALRKGQALRDSMKLELVNLITKERAYHV